MEKLNKPVFNKLKGYLSENQLTYKDVATLINCSTTSISRKISGQTQWNWEELVLIKNNLISDDDVFMNIFFNTEVTEV